jgi:hypothetical protein
MGDVALANVQAATQMHKVPSFAGFRANVTATLADTWGRDRFDALNNNAGYGAFNAIASRNST